MPERISMSIGLGVVVAVVALAALAAGATSGSSFVIMTPFEGILKVTVVLLGLLLQLSVLVVIIAVAVWLALRLLPGLGSQSTTGADLGESAVEILKQQYARGEITRDQYLQMHQDLQL